MFALEPRAALRAFAGFLLGLGVWVFLSPLYDRPLARAATAVIRMFEKPPVTRLRPMAGHTFAVDRADFHPMSQRPVIEIRTLTVSFMLLTALFAAEKRPWADRNVLGFVLASVTLAVTHLLGVIAEVMSIYALRLGPWSLVHYNAFERNLWGAMSHANTLVLSFGFAIAAWWLFRPADTPPAGGARWRGRKR